MKIFFDTEFIEGFSKWTFAKNRHFIDLISIGMVAEDGRKYYAISNEYRYNDADKWVKENVILPMYIDTVHGDMRNRCDVKDFHKHYGKTNKQIAIEIYNFCLEGDKTQPMGIGNPYEPVVEFYGYYADYDWVLFCSLFGRMIDLPTGFPMYCIDLKQTLDEAVLSMNNYQKLEYGLVGSLNPQTTFAENLKRIKQHPNFPKQQNEHNASSDAQWNYELYKFLQTL